MYTSSWSNHPNRDNAERALDLRRHSSRASNSPPAGFYAHPTALMPGQVPQTLDRPDLYFSTMRMPVTMPVVQDVRNVQVSSPPIPLYPVHMLGHFQPAMPVPSIYSPLHRPPLPSSMSAPPHSHMVSPRPFTTPPPPVPPKPHSTPVLPPPVPPLPGDYLQNLGLYTVPECISPERPASDSPTDEGNNAMAMSLAESDTNGALKLRQKLISQEEADLAKALEASMLEAKSFMPLQPKDLSSALASSSAQDHMSSGLVSSQIQPQYLVGSQRPLDIVNCGEDEAFARLLAAEDNRPSPLAVGKALGPQPNSRPSATPEAKTDFTQYVRQELPQDGPVASSRPTIGPDHPHLTSGHLPSASRGLKTDHRPKASDPPCYSPQPHPSSSWPPGSAMSSTVGTVVSDPVSATNASPSDAAYRPILTPPSYAGPSSSAANRVTNDERAVCWSPDQSHVPHSIPSSSAVSFSSDRPAVASGSSVSPAGNISRATSMAEGVIELPEDTNLNSFVEKDLFNGVTVGFMAPKLSNELVPMLDQMPPVISLPYGKARPLHLQGPSWRHLLKLMARLSGTRIEPSLDAVVATKTPHKLRTVIQFVKPHQVSPVWRTIFYFTIDFPDPTQSLHAHIHQNVNELPYSYSLAGTPTLLRDAADNSVSKTYTIPASESVPFPTLPIPFPELAMYLQAALQESRRYLNDSSSHNRKLAKMIKTCYPAEDTATESSTHGVGGLFKRVMGRSNKNNRGGGNEDTYQLVTPFLPNEWG